MLQARKATNLIVVHCSATTASMNWGRADIDRSHRARGFVMIGYHFVIRRDGKIETGRELDKVGAHVEGHNANSIGICMVGGLAAVGGRGENNFTPAQFVALAALLKELRGRYPQTRICGHRDLSKDRNGDGKITPNEWSKECPSFDVADFCRAHDL